MTARRDPAVLSIIRGADAGAARATDPALDANAYAVVQEIGLTVVLKDRGVELGMAGTRCDQGILGGLALPVAQPTIDLRVLLASGVAVYAVTEDLRSRGIDPSQLVAGIAEMSEDELAVLIGRSDVVLTTSS